MKALLLLAAALASGEAQAPEAAGVDVLHHDVALEPDFVSKTVGGRTRLTLRVVRTGERLEFSDNALTLQQATVDGRPARVDRADGRLRITPAARLRAGRRVVVEVAHAGTPARGLTFLENGAYTAYNTCDWTICDIDRPGDKASFSLELTLPAGFDSVASGTRVRTRRAKDGREVHAWREARPYSNYLFGFAAGRFEEATLRQGRVELALASQVASPERMRALFQTTGPMLAFFEDKAGVPFPQARYTQVLTPDSAAQEASSFSLVGANLMNPILETPQEDWLIAHELAHQWWGNLVTNASWEHFWLNEGVTTFMVAAWKEHRWGRAAYDREMTLARGRRARAAEAGFDMPLAYAGAYPSLPIKRAITYSKGALFMDELRQRMGEPRFWAGLRRFTRTHAGGTVTSRDFQAAMQAEAAEDLSPLFDEWVHPPMSAKEQAARP